MHSSALGRQAMEKAASGTVTRYRAEFKASVTCLKGST